MAASTRAMMAIKPHIPMIKFPARKPGGFETVSSVQTGGAPVSISTSGSSTTTTQTSSSSKPIGYTSRGTGIDYSELPAKYRRKLMSLEEMEYIERGGPE